jgi:hypothetical protein
VVDPIDYPSNAGASRKLLELTFQGQIRDADGMVLGDVEIDGLTEDVCESFESIST